MVLLSCVLDTEWIAVMDVHGCTRVYMFTVYSFPIVYNCGQVCSVCGQTSTAPKGNDKQTKKTREITTEVQTFIASHGT